MSSSTTRSTRTGGRPAITGVIRGKYSLSVGDPGGPTPDGWRWTLLSSVARLESGHTPSRKHPEYWEGDIPWIGIRDATANHGRTLTDTAQHTNALGIANSSARVLPANTVCLSRTASVGYVVMTGRPMATSQDFVNWVCSDAVDPRFLKYVLLAEKDTFLSFASGTTHQTIYYPEVKAFHICLPSVHAQRQIADVLSAFDDLIENNRRRIELLEQMAQAVYREWFVNFRYPGHNDDDLVDSNLGAIPAGWEVATIEDLAESLGDGDWIETKDQGGGDYRLLQVSNIAVGRFRETGKYRYITQKTFDRLRCREVRIGDLLISRMPEPVGRSWLVDYLAEPAITAVDVAILTPASTAEGLYLNFVLNSPTFLAHAENVASGTTRKRITRKVLAQYRLVRPPKAELAVFEAVAAPLAAEGLRLRLLCDSLAAIRDLLLPKLVTGEIDVSELDLDTLVEAASA